MNEMNSPAEVDRPSAASPERTDRSGAPRRSGVGWAAPLAALSLIAAAAHIPVTPEHLEEAPYIGALFIALEVAAVVLAIAVLLRPSRPVYLLIAAVGALAVLALVISRTVGLPLIGDDIGNWAEPLAVVSLVVETMMVLGGLLAARVGALRTTYRRVGLAVGGLVLVLGLAATAVAASAEPADDDMGGMTDMSGMQM